MYPGFSNNTDQINNIRENILAPDNNDPTVSIFGKDIDTENWEYETSHRVIWGGLVLLAGVIFLFNELEVIPWNIWREIINFWPFLLILSGLQILLGSGALSRLIMILITISAVALVLLSILQTPYPNLLNGFPSFVQDAVNYMESLNR